MRKEKIIRKILLSFLLSQLFVLCSPFLASANADDLVIEDDGGVVLVITNNSGVLAETTVAPKIPVSVQSSQPQPAAKPQAPTPAKSVPQPVPAQTVPLVPPHTRSTVQVIPPINNDKKINATITTGPSAPVSPPTAIQKSIAPPTTPAASGKQTVSAPTNVNAITKTVDQVVAQGLGGEPIVSIKSDKANQITIQQKTTQASTPLPVQIDTQTHAISVVTSSGPVKVSVLPNEAVKGIGDQKLITNPDAAKTTLTQENGQTVYTVRGEKKGKLFGAFNVTSPVEVKLSAQNGKVINTVQSPLFNALGLFIR